MPVLLGLDVGLSATGLVVVEATYTGGQLTYEVIAAETIITSVPLIQPPAGSKRKPTKPDVTYSNLIQAQQLFTGIMRVINTYKPVVLVAEPPAGGSKGHRAAQCMALSVGVYGSVLVACGLPAVKVTRQAVKAALFADELAALAHEDPDTLDKLTKRMGMDWVASHYPSPAWPKKPNGEYNKSKYEHQADAMLVLEVGKKSVLKVLADDMV